MAKQAQVWTPKQLAAELTALLGRNVSPKQVRGAVRGDSAAPILPKYADDGWTAHLYTADERKRIIAAFTQRAARRGAAAPSKPAATRKPATRTRTQQRTRKPAAAVQPSAATTTADPS